MFELWPKISLSEREFKEKHNLSQEDFDSLRVKVINRDGLNCAGCNIHNDIRKINLHLIEENEKDPLKSSFVCLCAECHIVEHIDKAIEKEYIKLVNSSLSQGQLINVCRYKSLANNINNGTIQVLTKEPETYLEELRSGTLGKNRIKVIFSPKKYPWT